MIIFIYAVSILGIININYKAMEDKELSAGYCVFMTLLAGVFGPIGLFATFISDKIARGV